MPKLRFAFAILLFCILMTTGCESSASLSAIKADIDAGQYEKALYDLDAMIGKKDNLEARYYRAFVNLKLNRFEQAKRDYSAVLSEFEKLPLDFDREAFFAKYPFATKALEEYFELVCPFEKSQYGSKGYRAGDFSYPDEVFDEAKRICLVYEKLVPKAPISRLMFGKAHLVKGWPIPGYNNISVYCESNPDDKMAIKWRADAAREFFTTVTDPRVFQRLKLGIIRDYETAIEAMPNNAAVLHSRAVYYFLANETDLALKDLRDALALDDKFAPAYFDLALVIKDTGRHQQAFDYFTKAIEYAPDFIEPYYHRAHLVVSIYSPYGLRSTGIEGFANSREANEFARKDIEAILKYIDDSYDVWSLYGDVWRNLSNSKEGVKAYTKAIEYNPKSHNAYYRRGDGYGLLGEYEKAFEDLRMAESLADDLDSQYYLYWFTLGKYQQAAASLAGKMKENAKRIELLRESVVSFRNTYKHYVRWLKHDAVVRGEIKTVDDPVILNAETAEVIACIGALWSGSVRELNDKEESDFFTKTLHRGRSGSILK